MSDDLIKRLGKCKRDLFYSDPRISKLAAAAETEIESLRSQLASANERGDQYHAENDELFKRAVRAEMQLGRARAAMRSLCDEIEADEQHGGGADETDCPICEAIRDCRALTDEVGA